MKVRLHFFASVLKGGLLPISQCLGIGIIGFLVGCTGLSPDRYLFNKQSFMLSEGHPPAYVAGYVDGCSAGRRLGGDNRFVYRKNNARFDKDALYAQGWQEGQINCRNEALTEDIQPVPRHHGTEKQSKSSQSGEKMLEVETKKVVDEENRAAEEEMRKIWDELRK